jgi:hypothetical protein
MSPTVSWSLLTVPDQVVVEPVHLQINTADVGLREVIAGAGRPVPITSSLGSVAMPGVASAVQGKAALRCRTQNENFAPVRGQIGHQITSHLIDFILSLQWSFWCPPWCPRGVHPRPKIESTAAKW